MQFLQEAKQPKPYYSAMHKKIGSFNISDGLVDITDPCYNCDQNVWYAMFGYRIKPGMYNCYVNIANFPSKVKYDEDDLEVKVYGKFTNRTYTLQDRRIVDLIIEHENISAQLFPYTSLKGWELISNEIGVDAGMCGFYNHKPDFDSEEDWTNFWQNLTHYPRLKYTTCDIKPYGVTVSSGFGDGVYEVYKFIKDNETIALRLKFY